jgi:hypothetical protein
MGISSNFSHLNVEGCRFRHNGSQITDAAIRIHGSTHGFRYRLVNNRIYTNNNGVVITMSNNPFISKLKRNVLVNNTIYLEQNTLNTSLSSRYGILNSMDYAQFVTGTHYFLNDVIGLSNDKHTGFHAQMTTWNSYHKNRNLRFAQSDGSGLSAEFAKFSYIANNFSGALNSNGVSAGFAQNNAYSYRAVSNSSVVQNCSQGTRFGFRFGDTNNGLAIAENNIGLHGARNDNNWLGASLFITGNGLIGQQDNTRNYFQDTSPGRILAWDSNLQPGQNQFRVQTPISNPYSLPHYYPLHDPEDLNDCQSDPFFICVALDENDPYEPPFACNTLMHDVDRFAGMEEHVLRRITQAYATNALQFDLFQDVAMHKVGRTIDENLKAGKLVLPDTGVYVSMKQTLYTSSMAKFNRVDSLIPYNKNDSLIILAFEALDNRLWYWDSTAAALLEFIMLDSLNFSEQGLADYYFALDSLHYYWDNWLNQQILVKYKLSVQNSLAQSLNASIPTHTSNQHEVNERTINEILLHLVAQDEMTLDDSQKQTVESLAWLCPLRDGTAVYKARSIVYAYHPNAYFDNDSLCAIYGIQYRKPDQSVSNIQNKTVLMAYPNPTSDIIRVSLENKDTDIKIKHLRVLNIMGQVIINKQTSEQEISLTLKSIAPSSGILLIQVTDELNNHYQTRIVYEK